MYQRCESPNCPLTFFTVLLFYSIWWQLSIHFEIKSKNDICITLDTEAKVKWSALVFCKGNGHPCVATVEMKVRVKVGTGRKIGLLPFSRFCATPPPRAMVSLPNLQNISLFSGCTFLLTLIGFQYFYSVVCH